MERLGWIVVEAEVGVEVGLMLAGIEQKARQTADPDLHRHLPGFVEGVLALAEGKGSSVGKPS